MYLYEKNKDKLYIYTFLSDSNKMYEYRVEQMEQIQKDKRIFRGITGIGIENYEIFKLYENKFDIEIIPIENVNGSYHRLESVILGDKSREFLYSNYYFGNLNDNKIARVYDLNKLRYFLLINSQYRYDFDKKILDGILEIPESLYLLSLIEKEKFSLIKDKDISEQLNLFKLEQIKEIDLETIERMDNVGMVPGCYSNTIEKARNDAYILKLVKNKS